MATSKAPRHRLLEKDVENRKGVCVVCGPVRISKTGPKSFGCATRIAASHKKWVEANPDKAKANREQSSEHTLFDRDFSSLTASCTKCDRRVSMVGWNRGYICGVRYAELRPGVAPAAGGSCRDCWVMDRTVTYLSAGGVCARCTDPDATLLGRALRRAEYSVASETLPGDALLDELAEFGYTITRDGDLRLPSGNESAVAGWKTLGSERPWHEA